MTNWVSLIPGSLYSPPSWRWELAQWMMSTGRPVPDRYIDTWVDRARQHLTAGPGSQQDAVVEQAVSLYHHASRLRRAQLEAYLLTGEPLDIVAGRCDIAVPTAEAYRMLFFDVRLTARDKIALVIGPGLAAGLGDQELWRLWMAFAYNVGLAALDAVIAVSVEDGLVEGAADLPRTAPPVADKRLRKSVRLALDAMTLPADTSLEQLVELQVQARRMASRPRVRSVPDTLVAAVARQPAAANLDVQLPPEDTADNSVA